ncbi:hypothetical protein F0562_017366 [Nyssa sinensis]|uniref:Uncharacterized protein n=1 Tax=Nyssa sinensis TaxID=561372 RepID=A0A5J4ZEL5_9ASTE|nr:hypothetical protein F0562_017366 [Nyssa sinensis]
MAESFVNNVFGKLSSFALEEVYLAWNVKNELQKLSKTSTSIEEFLWSNADQQQQQAKSRQDEWHEKMEDIFYDVDDVLDEFQIELSKPQVFQGSISTKHVSFYDPDSPADELLIALREKKKVRSIYFQFNRVKPVERSFVETCISRFEFLRLLDLRESCFEALPSSISGLKHLRYLELSQNRSVKSLPDSLCKLLRLQSLILDGCVELEKLPRDFRNLTSLRFLHLTTQQRCFSKKGIGSLTSLRLLWITGCGNLEYFFVDDDDDDDDGSPMQCLAGLRALLIKDCERLLCLPSLRYLTSLEKLVISNCEKLDLMMADEGEMDALRSLQFFAIEQVPKLVALPQWLQGASKTL